MKAKVLLMMGLLALSGMAYAEGGCPQGQTPRLYGDVWGCAPGELMPRFRRLRLRHSRQVSGKQPGEQSVVMPSKVFWAQL